MHLRKNIMLFCSMVLLIACPVLIPVEQAYCLITDGTPQSVPIDARFKPRLGTYNYKVSYNRLDVINASIDINLAGDLYMMQVKAETTGTIDKMFRMRYQGQSITDTAPLSPVETKTQQKVRSKERFLTMSFLDNGMVKTTERKVKNGDMVSYDVKSLQADRFIFDPFSLSYLIRALDWQVGKSQTFTVYTGKKEYELVFKCIAETNMDFAGVKRSVWVIIPDVRILDDNKRFVDVKKKPSNMKIYLSADEYKDILKMEASHTLGYFQLIMTGFKPMDQVKIAASHQVEKT